MNRIKLQIVPSADKNLNLKVYRSTTPENVPAQAEVLQALQPVVEVNEATATVTGGRIDVYDYNRGIIPGITYHGPEPSGLEKPNVTAENDTYSVAGSPEVPYIRLIPKDSELGLMYYYRVVGVDPTNKITNPSALMISPLAQPSNLIQYQVEVSDDFTLDDINATWTTLPVLFNAGEDIEIGKPNSPNFAICGKSVLEDVGVFQNTEILVDTTSVNSDNTLCLNIPNVWCRNDLAYNFRPRKAFKITAKAGELYSDTSNVIADYNPAPVPMERMVILKKRVTGLGNPNAPLTYATEGASILREWLRKDGLYYNPILHDVLPYNMPITINGASTQVIDLTSTFLKFAVYDDSCIPGETYNYTFYLYDSFGTESAPIVLTVVL